MAPRHKYVKSSGSKKGTQINYHFLSKCPDKGIPSRFPKKAPLEGDTQLQGIFYIFFIYLLISKDLKKRPQFSPQKQAPYGNRHHFQDLC
jgi:hypothetical protein